MRCFTFTLSCLFAVSAIAEDKKPAKLKGDLKAMQGEWLCTTMLVDGKDNLAQAKQAGVELKFEFKGNKMMVHGGPGGEAPATFTLDSTKKPKHLNLTFPSRKPIKAIYELKGKKLRMSGPKDHTGDRATKFDGSAGSEQVLIVLERPKKTKKKDGAKKGKADKPAVKKGD